jgi:hypothetical protein
MLSILLVYRLVLLLKRGGKVMNSIQFYLAVDDAAVRQCRDWSRQALAMAPSQSVPPAEAIANFG